MTLVVCGWTEWRPPQVQQIEVCEPSRFPMPLEFSRTEINSTTTEQLGAPITCPSDGGIRYGRKILAELKLDREVLQNLSSLLHGRPMLGENFVLAINDRFGFIVVG